MKDIVDRPITGAVAKINAAFGQGIRNGHIFLDDVQCTSYEQRLFDCRHAGFEVNNCFHRQDAGVVCIAGECLRFASIP